jgi:transposase
MARAATAPKRQDSTGGRVLYLAFELSQTEWRLGFTTGLGQRPRQRVVKGGDLEAVEREIEAARRRFRLAQDTEVVSCYEAGRDGFWLHRYMESRGFTNYVVDSTSIEVKQRAKRVKTDRLDLISLVRLLVRYCGGEPRVWSIVKVPSPEAEDARHLHRELTTLKRERTRSTSRLKGLLATQGLKLELGASFEEVLEATLLWDGWPVPDLLCRRLKREWRHRQWLCARIREVEAERRQLVRTSSDPAVGMVRQLCHLRGIGLNSAWLLVHGVLRMACVREPPPGRGAGRPGADSVPEWRIKA